MFLTKANVVSNRPIVTVVVGSRAEIYLIRSSNKSRDTKDGIFRIENSAKRLKKKLRSAIEGGNNGRKLRENSMTPLIFSYFLSFLVDFFLVVTFLDLIRKITCYLLPRAPIFYRVYIAPNLRGSCLKVLHPLAHR